jgi:hypothetical protein
MEQVAPTTGTKNSGRKEQNHTITRKNLYQCGTNRIYETILRIASEAVTNKNERKI